MDDARHPGPKKLKMAALGVITVILVASAALAITANAAFRSPLQHTEGSWLIEPGESSRAIATRLVASGVVDISPLVLRAYIRLTSSKGAMKAGEYDLRAADNLLDLVALFRSGRVVQHRITIPEGLTLEQWRVLLQEDHRLRHVAGKYTDAELAIEVGTNDNLEGWLFPDTYYFERGVSDLMILQRAHEKQKSVLHGAWLARGENLSIENERETLILASIVEKETGYPGDRGLVAGVFHNRLARNMRLQSDPTVIYGIKNFDGDLRRSHLTSPGPYNTYMTRGLPPTPICNPGAAAIEATLHPAAGSYLYFVAKGDGTSAFSESLEEHDAAVARYQLKKSSSR